MSGPSHAVCVTGLQRSFPEIARNIHAALASLYAPDALADAVAFFGVRPEKDPWSAVRVHLPPLANETLQRPCGYAPPSWFSAYARNALGKHLFALNFVQSLCDQAKCLTLIEQFEAARGGVRFTTLARLRLDLAWEATLPMPARGLQPMTVHLPRMNSKAGVNDKWAIGLREPMAVYLARLHAVTAGNLLVPSRHAANTSSCTMHWLAGDAAAGAAVYSFQCEKQPMNAPFGCRPAYYRQTQWQGRMPLAGTPLVPHTRNATRDAVHVDKANGLVRPHKFSLTSEGFLHWALWRRNVSVHYEPAWMFCKFGDASNGSVRVCVPRMRKRQPCVSLSCQSSGVDCGCANHTCVHWDKHAHKNVTHWYCAHAGGRQLALDGTMY